MWKTDGCHSTHSVIGSVYYDYELGEMYTPYFGVGVGFAHNRVVSEIPKGGAYTRNNKFAYQLMGGVHYKIQEKTYAGLEYKYLASDKDSRGHSVSATIKRHF